MLTKEQKDAFARARNVCAVIKRGHNQYAVRHPWRDIDGPSTESAASWPYIAALQQCARLTSWEAMRALGYSSETCEWAVGDYPQGRAIEVFKTALAKAGPVEAQS